MGGIPSSDRHSLAESFCRAKLTSEHVCLCGHNSNTTNLSMIEMLCGEISVGVDARQRNAFVTEGKCSCHVLQKLKLCHIL